MRRRARVLGREIAEMDGQKERRVELGLSCDLGQRADLVVPAPVLQ